MRSTNTCLLGLIAIASSLLGHATAQISLGSAIPYGVTANTAITNTGNTVINGRLALAGDASSITGFPPGISRGNDAGNAAAADACRDARSAYNTAAGLVATSRLSANLGTRSLAPGVYAISSSAELNGALVLDGQNNLDSQFVFQIGSTLTTATASTVSLINGVQACNVFWQVGSSATLGTQTVFAGNVLALTSITLNEGVSVDGGLYAINGAVTLINDLVTAQEDCAAQPDGSGASTSASSATVAASSTAAGEEGATTVDGSATVNQASTTTVAEATIPSDGGEGTTVSSRAADSTTTDATTINATTTAATTTDAATTESTTIDSTTTIASTTPSTTTTPLVTTVSTTTPAASSTTTSSTTYTNFKHDGFKHDGFKHDGFKHDGFKHDSVKHDFEHDFEYDSFEHSNVKHNKHGINDIEHGNNIDYDVFDNKNHYDMLDNKGYNKAVYDDEASCNNDEAMYDEDYNYTLSDDREACYYKEVYDKEYNHAMPDNRKACQDDEEAVLDKGHDHKDEEALYNNTRCGSEAC